MTSNRCTDCAAWVRTKERMPEDGQEVLVYHVLGDRSGAPMTMDLATRINGKWIYPWDRGGINPTPWLVTHWMPISPPTATGERT